MLVEDIKELIDKIRVDIVLNMKAELDKMVAIGDRNERLEELDKLADGLHCVIDEVDKLGVYLRKAEKQLREE